MGKMQTAPAVPGRRNVCDGRLVCVQGDSAEAGAGEVHRVVWVHSAPLERKKHVLLFKFLIPPLFFLEGQKIIIIINLFNSVVKKHFGNSVPLLVPS